MRLRDGQLTNFLSIANRTVFGTDICLNSLRLGAAFRAQQPARPRAVPADEPVPAGFKPDSFDLVVSNGVLHHTSIRSRPSSRSRSW